MAMVYGGTREMLRWYTLGRRLLFDGKKNHDAERKKELVVVKKCIGPRSDHYCERCVA